LRQLPWHPGWSRGHNVVGSVIQNNTIYGHYQNNNLEYGGCALGGTYGIQINFAGESIDVSNNTIKNNTVKMVADVCESEGFAWSSATIGSGPNHTLNNLFSCTLAPGSTATPCAGNRLDALQYSPSPDNSVISIGDTYLGDTSAIYIYYDGTPTWTCNQCTFGKSTNPVPGWVLLDYFGGNSVGGSSHPMFLIDPTFVNGATASSNNLARWASNNPSFSFSYTIQWTYTVTAKTAASGSPISGATVTAVDAQGNTECSGTTNSSGIFSCTMSDTKYGASGGKYTTASFNPYTFTISANGCSVSKYTETILGTTNEVKTLGGC
jgi:hypothetical protein